MKNYRPKNPFEAKQKPKLSLLWLKLKNALCKHMLNKELAKPSAVRDLGLIEELYQTISLITDYIAVLEQNARNSFAVRLKRGLSCACIVIAFLLSASAVAQIAGFRIWTALIKGDTRYLYRDYLPSAFDITEETAFSSLAEVYNRIDAELYLPEEFKGAAAENITVAPSDRFSDNETKEMQFSINYRKGDKFMNVVVYMTDSGESSVFGNEYPIVADYISESSEYLGQANDASRPSASSPQDSSTSDQSAVSDKDASAISQGTDISDHIAVNDDVLSVGFVYQSRLYIVDTNTDFVTLYNMLFQIAGRERLDLLG